MAGLHKPATKSFLFLFQIEGGNMPIAKRNLSLCVASALALASAEHVRAGAALPGSITILSNSVETETEAIGGGGATPFSLGPVVMNSGDLFSNTVNNLLATGVQDAFDAASNHRGTGSGTGIADGSTHIDLLASTITGDLATTAQFTATPDLGTGLGQADATLRIVFRPTIDTDYTLDASLTPVVGPIAGNDAFSIRRTSQLGNPIVHLINNAASSDIVGATGTFLAGVEYTLFADLTDSSAGGSAQGSGDAQTLASFNLVFDLGTQFQIGGDLNGDGFVGIDDLNLVLGNWNQNVPPGNPLADPNGDGFVGIDDLNEVLSNWNQAFPEVPPPSAVPEPASAGLLLIGAALGASHRTTRRD